MERTIQREEVQLQPVIDRDAILEVRACLPRGAGRAARAGLRHRSGDGHAARHAGGARSCANKYIRYGSSPRGAQALVECGRVLALMRGRFHLSTDDVRAVAAGVLRHRIILNFDAHADGQTPETILKRDHR